MTDNQQSTENATDSNSTENGPTYSEAGHRALVLNRRQMLQLTAGSGAVAYWGDTISEPAMAAENGGDLEWRFATGGAVSSSMTVVNGIGFIGSSDTNVYAIDVETGEEAWDDPFETGASVQSSPTVVDDTVYVGSFDTNIYAIDAATGEEYWHFETNDVIESSPTVVNDTVYIGGFDNNVYAIDVETGEEAWDDPFETNDVIESSPSVVGGTVYIGSDDNNVYAIDVETGEEVWDYPFETGASVQSSPTVVNNIVYVGSSDNNVYAIDAITGKEYWRFETNGVIYSSPTVADDTVYIGSGYLGGDNSIYAIDAATGEEYWHFETGDRVISSPTVVDDAVYIGGFDNNVYAIDAATGEEYWHFETGDGLVSSPMVVDGTVFVGSNDQNIYALDAGVTGSSEGSRVMLGTLGHHREWAAEASTTGGTENEIDADIINVDVNADRVTHGDTVPADITIRNTGTTEQEFYVDYNVVAPDEEEPHPRQVNGEDGAQVTLAPGDEATVTVAWEVDDDASMGIYDIYIAVYDQDPRADVTVPRDETTLQNAFELRGSASEIDAEITAFETDSGTVERGETVESTVTIVNIGTVEHTFYVGYSMIARADGEAYSEDVTGTRVALEPGEQQTVTVTWTAPEDAPAGPYDAVTAVWEESSVDELDTQLDRAENEAAINIETDTELTAAFDILTEDPVVGEEIEFDASDSEASNGTVEEYWWDMTGNGEIDVTGETITYEFDDPGDYEITLTVVDSNGNEDSNQQIVSVVYDDPPEIHADTIKIDPIAVETESESGLLDGIFGGDEDQEPPMLSVDIERAEEARVDVVVDDERRDQVKMEKKDGNLWKTEKGELPTNEPPGTRVDLRIKAWNSVMDREEWITQSKFENLYIRESTNLSYYIFNKVFDIAVVLARFKNDGPDDVFRGIEPDQWLSSEKIDINCYYGSGRGSMGAVGFNITYFDKNGDGYEVASQKHYEGFDISPEDIEEFEELGEPHRGHEFLDDLHEEAKKDVNFNEFDLWIGRHFGRTILTTEDGEHFAGYTSQKQSRIYVPFRPNTKRRSDFGLYYDTFIHELGHAIGAQHLHDKGNVKTECVMGVNHDETRENFAPDAPPLSTALRISNYLELDFTDKVTTRNEIQDWLTVPEEWRLDDLYNDGEELTIPALQQYQLEDRLGDESAIINTDDGGDIRNKYIIEYRPFLEGYEDGEVQWHPEADGSVVVYQYRQNRDEANDIDYNIVENTRFFEEDKRFLTDKNSTIRDKISIMNALWIEFELNNKFIRDRAQANVQTQLESGLPNTITIALRDESISPDIFELFQSSITCPNLDLKAVDSEGRIVGVNNDGEYVNEIPDARSSGKQVRGLEWISVPADAEVEFVVSSQDTQSFIEEISEFTGATDENQDLIKRMQTDYWISVTQYGENPEVTRENDVITVSDTITKVSQEIIEPGNEQSVEVRNEKSDCEIVEINLSSDPTNEYVVFQNTGDTILDLSGWTVEGPDGQTYSFPEGFTLEPGETVTLYTGSGTDTDTELYWGKNETVWEDNDDQVVIYDSEEETVLNVWYDDRQMIYYDEPPEPEDEAEKMWDVDLPDWMPLAGAAGVGIGAAGYLYGRYLRQQSSNSETER